MNNHPAPTAPEALSIGRLIYIDDLEGGLARHLSVPEGWQGVASYPDGEVKTFDPGRHTVLTLWQRMGGRGVGARVALISKRPFMRLMPVFGLSSYDDQLLKAQVVLQITISDAALFLSQAPGSGGRLEAPAPDPFQLSEQMRPLVRQFAAADLLSGAAAASLARDLLPLFEAHLVNCGLRLLGLPAVTFTSAEEQLKAAEAEHSRQQKLEQLAHEARLAELERQAEQVDFARQLGLEEQAGAEAAAAQKEPGAVKQPAAPARGQATEEGALQAEERPVPAAPSQVEPLSLDSISRLEPVKVPSSYLNLQVTKIVVSISAMALLTMFANELLRLVNLQDKIQVTSLLTGLWVSIIVLSGKTAWDIFEKVRKAEKANEAASSAGELDPGSLAVRQYTSVDHFLRAQVSQELDDIGVKVEDAWNNLSARGQTEAAWCLKELVPAVRRLSGEVNNPSVGLPAYLVTQGSPRDLQMRQLEYDQALLLRVEYLSDLAGSLQRSSVGEVVSLEEARGLQRQLLAFEERFKARRRSTQALDRLMKDRHGAQPA